MLRILTLLWVALLASAQTLPPQSPGEVCVPEVAASYECSIPSTGTSQAGSAACSNCHVEKMNFDQANGIRTVPCEEIRDVLTTELSKCRDECYPATYECSDLDFVSGVCILTDLFSKNCALNGGSTSANAGGSGGTGSDASADRSGAMDMTFPGRPLWAVLIVSMGALCWW